MLWNSRIVILDEPTAALGVAQTEQVLKLVRRLADRGLGVVLISHNLNDVFEVADDIAVLYLGQLVAQVETRAVNNSQVVELITAGRSGSLGLQGGRRLDEHVHDRRPMSTTGVRGAPTRTPDTTTSLGAQATSGDYVTRVRGGDVGSLPAVLGLVVLCIVFATLRTRHVHQRLQLRQPHQPGGGVTVIAMGLVFVLLLGEIDLSAGFTAGTAACMMAIVLTRTGRGTGSPRCWCAWPPVP